jgi:predicted nucleotidyltransferase
VVRRTFYTHFDKVEYNPFRRMESPESHSIHSFLEDLIEVTAKSSSPVEPPSVPDDVRRWIDAGIAQWQQRRVEESAARLAAAQDGMVPLLRDTWPVEEIWVFGSVARETAGEDSDIDLFVVLDTSVHCLPFPEKLEMQAKMARLAKQHGVPYALDMILWAREDFLNGQRNGSVFLETILNEGRKLYGR